MKKKIFASLVLAFLMSAAGAFASEMPAKLGITYVKAPLNVPSIVEKYNKVFVVLPERSNPKHYTIYNIG